jgi:hypothetical protein
MLVVSRGWCPIVAVIAGNLNPYLHGAKRGDIRGYRVFTQASRELWLSANHATCDNARQAPSFT